MYIYIAKPVDVLYKYQVVGWLGRVMMTIGTGCRFTNLLVFYY